MDFSLQKEKNQIYHTGGNDVRTDNGWKPMERKRELGTGRRRGGSYFAGQYLSYSPNGQKMGIYTAAYEEKNYSVCI